MTYHKLLTMANSKYEQEERKAAQNRAWGYALLWIFLGAFVYGLSVYTGRSYPLDATVSVIMLTIGAIKAARLLVGKPSQNTGFQALR